MFEFDYEKEAEKMIDIKIDIDVITSEYIRKLSLCSLESLQALNVIYIYNKLYVIANMSPKNRTTFEEERREKLTQGLNLIKRKLNTYYSYDIKDDEEIKRIVERMKLIEESRTNSAYNVLQDYKNALKKLYEESLGVVRTVLPTHNLKHINKANHRENQYLNEIVDGIFAVGDYNGLMDYIARANSKGMIVRKNQIFLPTNPFDIANSSNQKLKLTKPVSIYDMSVKDFEPVIDFYLDAGNKPILRFDNEWIARKEKVRCKESIIDYLPKDFLLNRNVTVNDYDTKININEIIDLKTYNSNK